MSYDAENKQKSFGTSGSSTNGGSYFYDGDGLRVKKIVGSETTVFVYNASGQMVAEYTTTAPTNPTISYLTSDTLGSPRINTDQSGQVSARHDYMPFGEEITGSGGRSIQQGYNVDDGVNQQFTGQFRDEESGLDYFNARYYLSLQGRFISIDPICLQIDRMYDPQRFNLYVYARSNPLKFVDPTGMDVILEGKEVDYFEKNFQNGLSFQTKVIDGKVKIVDSNGNVITDKKQLDKIKKGLSKKEQTLFSAITDPSVMVTINTETRNDTYHFAVRNSSTKTVSVDRADFEILDESQVGLSAEELIKHEVAESYLLGKDKNKYYEDAHFNNGYSGLVIVEILKLENGFISSGVLTSDIKFPSGKNFSDQKVVNNVREQSQKINYRIQITQQFTKASSEVGQITSIKKVTY